MPKMMVDSGSGSEPAQHALGRSAFTALKWNYLGVATRTLSSFVIGIVLARLLGPKPFGQVAVAWLVIGLGNLLADCGFGAALVQRNNLNSEQIRFAFISQLIVGFAITALVAATAPWIALLFRQPDVTPVIRSLSLVFTFQAAGLTAVNLLKRELAFRKLQVAQVISYLVGYLALGIPMACNGFGVWSLIAAQLTQSFLYSAQAYLFVRHPLRPLLRCRDGQMTSFGSKVVGVNISNWLIGNSDNAIVGRVFGAIGLGLYDRSLTLMTTPMNGIVTTLQSVLFPTYSRAQNQPAWVRRAYLTSVAGVQLCVLPMFLVIAAVPGSVIRGLYGPRWPAAIPLLIPFALARPFNALMALAGPLLWGIGKVEYELRVQVVTAMFFIPAVCIASCYSVLWVSWTVCGILLIQSLLMTRTVLRVIGCDWIEVFRVVRGPVLLSAAVAPAVWVCDRSVFASLPAAVRLSADVLSAVAVMGPLLILAPGKFLCHELLDLTSARGWDFFAVAKRLGISKTTSSSIESEAATGAKL